MDSDDVVRVIARSSRVVIVFVDMGGVRIKYWQFEVIV